MNSSPAQKRSPAKDEITPIENAGQLNAYMTLNIRGKRSKTDSADNDPKVLDALETARAQDEYFARTGNRCVRFLAQCGERWWCRQGVALR